MQQLIKYAATFPSYTLRQLYFDESELFRGASHFGKKIKVHTVTFFGNFFHSTIFLAICCVQDITREILNIKIIYLPIWETTVD